MERALRREIRQLQFQREVELLSVDGDRGDLDALIAHASRTAMDID